MKTCPVFLTEHVTSCPLRRAFLLHPALLAYEESQGDSLTHEWCLFKELSKNS